MNNLLDSIMRQLFGEGAHYLTAATALALFFGALGVLHSQHKWTGYGTLIGSWTLGYGAYAEQYSHPSAYVEIVAIAALLGLMSTMVYVSQRKNMPARSKPAILSACVLLADVVLVMLTDSLNQPHTLIGKRHELSDASWHVFPVLALVALVTAVRYHNLSRRRATNTGGQESGSMDRPATAD